MANERGFWTDERIQRVANLAAAGLYGSQIGADIGCSLHSILTICGRYKIPVNRYTPEEQAYFDQKTKAREARKYAAWRAKNRVSGGLTLEDLRPGTSKTSPVYRNTLPRLPDDTSKAALRAMIAEALRNTAEARA
jgi:hypothetical protein